MKIELAWGQFGTEQIHGNATYDVFDNTYLESMTLSKTVLHIGKSTRGHSHEGQDEIYIFLDGSGMMIVGEERIPVSPLEVISVRAGLFHQVKNSHYATSDLVFYSIYPGQRSYPWDTVTEEWDTQP